MSETFGVWELRERLGQNELGDTHLAVRTSDGTRAVIKRIHRDGQDERLAAALTQELAQAAQLNHPSAARILEQGEIRGIPYVAIEHVLGISLARASRAANALHAWPLSAARAAAVMAPVLDALAAAHALTPPLLHRELVPENVRIDGTGRVVLTDFGLGRARLRAGGSAGMRGAYVSPEQARGNAIDARSEVFAAGLMLFELACGRLPAQGGAGEVITRIATGELDAPRAVNPAVDAGLAAVLERALAAKPEDRFASAAALRAALAPWLATPEAEPLGAWAQKLAMVQLPPVAATPIPPPPPPVAAPQPATRVEAVEAPVAVRAVPPDAAQKAAKRRARWIAGAVVAAGAVLIANAADVGALFDNHANTAPSGRSLELTTIPSGAQVWVDGVLEERRTPLTLRFPKDEFRSLTLRKQGHNAWSGIVYNTKKLEVTLATGELEEEKYEGQSRKKPPQKAEAPAPVAPSVTDDAPPKPEVVFDVEAPPIETTLTHAHSVRADLGPSLDVAAGDELALVEGGSLYFSNFTQSVGRNSSAMRYPNGVDYETGKFKTMPAVKNAKSVATYRPLNLFALHVEGTQPLVYDLSRPVTAAFPGKYYLFSPTQSGELSQDRASVRVGDVTLPVAQSHLLHVDAIDCFLVRVLQPKQRYRLELTRADGSNAPLPPVVMTLRPDQDATSASAAGEETSIRFDGAALESGQALVSAGSHTVTGARSVWFTVITAGDGPVPEVKLSMKPVEVLMRVPLKKGK